MHRETSRRGLSTSSHGGSHPMGDREGSKGHLVEGAPTLNQTGIRTMNNIKSRIVEASDLRSLQLRRVEGSMQLLVAERQVRSTNHRMSPIMGGGVPTLVAQMSQLFNRARVPLRMATISKLWYE